MKEKIDTQIIVQNTPVVVKRIDSVDYLSLTDIARYQNSSDPSFTIKNWLRRVSTLDYLALWERLSNENFNLVEFDQIKTVYGKNSFTMSPTQWVKRTNAIGIVSKRGKYSPGTFAHPDIAFEFASWLSPEFKLYLIKEFERLKSNEAYQNKIEWHANRQLAAASYAIHTDAIKENIIPKLSDEQKKFVYANEADVLNVALFGMTAKEWRDQNPKFAAKNENIRDHTDGLHLIIISNLENINAELMRQGIPQSERLVRLNTMAKKQLELLANNASIAKIQKLENSVNDKVNKIAERTQGGNNEA